MGQWHDTCYTEKINLPFYIQDSSAQINSETTVIVHVGRNKMMNSRLIKDRKVQCIYEGMGQTREELLPYILLSELEPTNT
jgi:hypothetical protein